MASQAPSNTARHILEQAPLGAMINFSDGRPRPPERFKRKLRDWETRNGTGRLVERHAGRDGRDGTFALHLGDFGGNGVVVMSFRRLYSASSSGIFAIGSMPGPGEALVITEGPWGAELQHAAADEDAARRWLEEHHYPGARIEVVGRLATDRAAA